MGDVAASGDTAHEAPGAFADPLVEGLLATAPVGIAMVDRDLRFVRANPQFRSAIEALGAVGPGLVGRSVEDVLPTLAGSLIPLCRAVLESGKPTPTLELSGATQDGAATRQYALGLFPVTSADGEVVGVGGVARDMTEQRAAQEALRTSEERYRQIVETAGEGIWMVDGEGRTVFANPRMAEILRTKADQLVGREPSDFVDQDRRDATRARLQAMAAGDGGPEELLFRRADGSEVWLLVHATRLPALGSPSEGILVMATDVDERRRAWEERERLLTAERDARERADATDRRIAEFLARVTDGFVAFDRSFHYTYVSDQAAAMLGRAADELLGRDYYEAFPEAVGTPFELAYARAMRDQVPIILEDHYAPWDRWFENRIFPSEDGLSIFFSEITDRKRLEVALRRNAERLDGLHRIDKLILAAAPLESIAALVVEHLRRVAAIDHAHVVVYEGGERHVLAISGIDAVKPGTTVDNLPGPTRDRLRLGAPFEMPVEDLPRNWFVDQLRAAGLRRDLLVPLSTDDGDTIGHVSILSHDPDPLPSVAVDAAVEAAAQMSIALRQARLRDDAARHTAELEDRVAARTAELRERNAELEAFSYTVSHDLRAPLRAIQGFSQALLEDYGDQLDGEGRDYLERVVKAGARLDLLIQDLLAYSRLSRADLQLGWVDLDVAVREALAQLDAELRERRASVEVLGTLPVVRAHGATLVQVLANLVSNAAKFVAADTQPVIRIRAERDHDRVRCLVEDNGIGVAPEHRDRIFRVFERLHGVEAYPGTGIGLAIVRKGLERMGGSTGMTGRAEGGSVFWIELPAIEEGA